MINLKKLKDLCLFISISLMLIFPATTFAEKSYQILVIGDQFSAGETAHMNDNWVFFLEQKFKKEKYPVAISNKSFRGFTAQDGEKIVPDLIKSIQPDAIIIALGMNDGLHDYGPTEMQQQLEHMIQIAKKSNATVILVGFKMPPKTDITDATYAKTFDQVYSTLKKKHHITLVNMPGEPQDYDYPEMAEKMFKILAPDIKYN
jgi:acyl-CoA thioesterase-1